MSTKLSASNFEAWYWLKLELQAFCQSQGLPVGGSKADLMRRISAYLSGAAPALLASRTPSRTALPQHLSMDTVIQPGWPLSHTLRDFFVCHVGMSFRFNQALRDLFRNPQGQTLAEALALYTQTRAQHAPIGQQFQFNQHMRDYFAEHPGATHAQALKAWKDKRQSMGTLNFFRSRP